MPVFEDNHLGGFQLEIFGRPGDYTDGFLRIDVDDFPQLGPGKHFIFKDSHIPFFPNIPHEKPWEGFPDSVKDWAIIGVVTPEFYGFSHIMNTQVFFSKGGRAVIPKLRCELARTKQVVEGFSCFQT
jgi:hypothetical protein